MRLVPWVALAVVSATACGGSSSGEDPLPPTFLSVPPTRAQIGALFAYDVQVEDPNHDAVSLTLRTSPSAARIVPGRSRLEWVPVAAQVGTQHFDLVARDAAGLEASQSFDVVVTSSSLPGKPTPLSPDRGPDFTHDYDFLFSGDGAPQQGVQPNAIDKVRLAILHGHVAGVDAAPLEGVRVSIKSQPELGSTTTSTNGDFHLAVNGGGLLTLRFERPGFLLAERQVATAWHGHTEVRDVALVLLSEQATVIEMGAANLQVARGPMTEDLDGSRQATLLIPPRTTAQAVLPDGSVVPTPKLTLRATEYTVGPRGAAAMPANLPPSSAYTYAVELSADEAHVLGATSVRFSQPVHFYVENFLSFSVGELVPVGAYDFETSAWKPEPDGRVILIMGHAGGQAVVDLNGDGNAEEPAALAAEGFTQDELAKLAELYRPGTTLWRVRLGHLTPWDCNWPVSPRKDSEAPKGEPTAHKVEPPKKEKNCEKDGSVIECDDGGLGQDLALPGTAYSIHYRSRRQPGWMAGRTVDIPLSGDQLPPGALAMIIELEVAGRAYRSVLPPTPSYTHRFIWDGQDAFGRSVFGSVPLNGRIGFAYRPVYGRSSAGPNGAFGRPSAITVEGATRTAIDIETTQLVLWRDLPPMNLEARRPRSMDLGGWTLDVHHEIDGDRLELGTGRDDVPWSSGITEVIAGATDPASPHFLSSRITGAVVTPDGAAYVTACDAAGSHGATSRLYRVFNDRPKEPVLGIGDAPLKGGGTLHLEPMDCANISRPVVDREGRIVLAYAGYLLRFDPKTRMVEHLAGTGVLGRDYRVTDNQVLTATAAGIPTQPRVAIGPQGQIVLASPAVIFDLEAGLLVPRAGFTLDCNSFQDLADRRKCLADRLTGFDGAPARTARFVAIVDLDFGPDGTLYVADRGNQNGQVRAIGIDGIVRRVAGLSWTATTAPERRWSLDYTPRPAAEVGLASIDAVRVSRSGRVFISHTRYAQNGGGWGTSLVSVFEPKGRLYWIAGAYESFLSTEFPQNPEEAFGVRGSPRDLHRAPNLCDVLTFHPSGRLVLTADRGEGALMALSLTADLNGLERIPSPDGLGMLVFDTQGRHVGLESALSGRSLRRFEYDDSGRLVSVVEEDGPETTTIERNAEGRPLAFVGPYGHRTTIGLGLDGYLSELRDPLGRTWHFEYAGTSGLLTGFVDPKGLRSEYTYDETGRLLEAKRPDGAVQRLTFAKTRDGFAMTHTSATGQVSRFESKLQSDGSDQRRVVDPGGRSRVAGATASGGHFLLGSDGTRFETHNVAGTARDALLPLPERVTVTLPSGAQAVLTAARSVSRDPTTQTLVAMEQTVQVGGRVAKLAYDRATRTLSNTSPAGRRSWSRYDENDRLVETQHGSLLPVRYSYDSRGRVVSASQGDRITQFEYDAAGNVAAVIDPAGRRTTYAYDAIDRLTQRTLPGGQTVAMAYDLNNALTRLTPPGRSAHQFEVDELARRLTYEAPSIGTTPTRFVTELDQDRRVQRGILPDQSSISVARDPTGRPSEVHFPDGVLRYVYHPASDRPASIVAPSGVETHLAWDGPRQIQEATTGGVGGVVRWTFDETFRPKTETVEGSPTINLTFDPDGLPLFVGPLAVVHDPEGTVIRESLGGVTQSRGQDDYGALTALNASFQSQAIASTQLTYDALGRIANEVETTSRGVRMRRVFYDTNGGVEHIEENGLTTERYTYDDNGNRLMAEVRGDRAQALYDAQDRLTSYGAWTIRYDGLGRVSQRIRAATTETWSYTYDTQGNLQQVTRPDGRTIEYVADGLDRRVARRLGATVTHGYVYSGDRVVAELAPDGSVRSRFVYGFLRHVPAGMLRDGTWFAFVTDARGSVRAVIDTTTGREAQRIDYDAFGLVLEDTQPSFQPFGFAGGLYDPDTGWVRFGARDYDPSVGRWTAKDPLGFAGGDTSLYVYAFNDPVNLIDPQGEIAFCPLLALALELYNIASAVDTVMDILEKSAEFMDPCTSDDRKMEMMAEVMAEMLGSALLGKIGEKIGKSLLKYLAKHYNIKACFIAGTLVATPGGPVPIESLTPGDQVLALRTETGLAEPSRIAAASTREVSAYLDLRLLPGDGGQAQHLGVTAEHPFWTRDGWVPAGELLPGALVLSESSGWLRVAGATWVQEQAEVFNLEVSELHSYGAGPFGAWVHNGCSSILQSGGNKLNNRTAEALNDAFDKNLTARDWGRALESLKKDLDLPNSHHGKIGSNGDYFDDSGNKLGNIVDYLP